MCVKITDAPKLWRKYVETWVFVAVSGQWPLGENIRGSSYWTPRNKLQWNSSQNTHIIIQENSFENVFRKWQPSCLGLNVLTSVHWVRGAPDRRSPHFSTIALISSSCSDPSNGEVRPSTVTPGWDDSHAHLSSDHHCGSQSPGSLRLSGLLQSHLYHHFRDWFRYWPG